MNKFPEFAVRDYWIAQIQGRQEKLDKISNLINNIKTGEPFSLDVFIDEVESIIRGY